MYLRFEPNKTTRQKHANNMTKCFHRHRHRSKQTLTGEQFVFQKPRTTYRVEIPPSRFSSNPRRIKALCGL